jgi:hypothetical protein
MERKASTNNMRRQSSAGSSSKMLTIDPTAGGDKNSPVRPGVTPRRSSTLSVSASAPVSSNTPPPPTTPGPASGSSSASLSDSFDCYSILPKAHRRYYDFLWTSAHQIDQTENVAADDNALLGGAKAVSFFEKSGLEVNTLRQIWSRCTANPTMNRKQFNAALRYITMVQTGSAVSRGEFKNLLTKELPLPKFQLDSEDQAPGDNSSVSSNNSRPTPTAAGTDPTQAFELLSARDQYVYQGFWSAACMNGAELLGGGNAVKFFEKSGLEIQSLKQIWSRCTPNPAMSKQEFFVALRYIAMAQNGFPISRGEYKDLMSVKLPLPIFEGVDVALPTDASSEPQAPAPQSVLAVASTVPEREGLEKSGPEGRSTEPSISTNISQQQEENAAESAKEPSSEEVSADEGPVYFPMKVRFADDLRPAVESTPDNTENNQQEREPVLLEREPVLLDAATEGANVHADQSKFNLGMTADISDGVPVEIADADPVIAQGETGAILAITEVKIQPLDHTRMEERENVESEAKLSRPSSCSDDSADSDGSPMEEREVERSESTPVDSVEELNRRLRQLEEELAVKNSAIRSLTSDLVTAKKSAPQPQSQPQQVYVSMMVPSLAVPTELKKITLTKDALTTDDMFQRRINIWLVRAGYAVVSNETLSLDSSLLQMPPPGQLPVLHHSGSFHQSQDAGGHPSSSQMKTNKLSSTKTDSSKLPMSMMSTATKAKMLAKQQHNQDAFSEPEDSQTAVEGRDEKEVPPPSPSVSNVSEDGDIDLAQIKSSETSSDISPIPEPEPSPVVELAAPKAVKQHSLSALRPQLDTEHSVTAQDSSEADDGISSPEAGSTGDGSRNSPDVNIPSESPGFTEEATNMTNSRLRADVERDLTNWLPPLSNDYPDVILEPKPSSNPSTPTHAAGLTCASTDSTQSWEAVPAPNSGGNNPWGNNSKEQQDLIQQQMNQKTPANRRLSIRGFASALFGGFSGGAESARGKPLQVGAASVPLGEQATPGPVDERKDFKDPWSVLSIASDLISSSSAIVYQKFDSKNNQKRMEDIEDEEDEEDDLILVRYNGASLYVTANELYLIVVQEMIALREALNKEI